MSGMRSHLLPLVLAASTLAGSVWISGCAVPHLDEEAQPDNVPSASKGEATAKADGGTTARTDVAPSAEQTPDAGTVTPATDSGVDAGPDPCAAANLIGCFTFDGAIVEDGSPTKLVSSYTQGVTLGAGRSGKGLETEPVTNLRFADSAAFHVPAVTVEAFIKISALPATTQIIFDADGRFAMGVRSNGQVLCQASPDGVVGGSVKIGQWVHVACALGGGVVRVFVDGVQVSQGGGGVGGDSGQLAIAGDAPNGDNRFNGSIDTLRIFNVARSATEIAADAK